MTTQMAPESMYRSTEGLGIWEHRGKVASVGIGHSPTARRWDGKPETSVGALSIQALRKAIADAGVPPEEVDGLVLVPVTTTGAYWPEDQPVTHGCGQRVQSHRRPVGWDRTVERGVDHQKHA